MSTIPMSTTGQHEITDGDLRHELFRELDARAKEIEQQFKSTWVELADICISMRDGGYWMEGGYSSYNSWLVSSCPCSRSWAYLAVGAREELKDISDVDLRQIPLGSAQILKRLPRATRAKKTVLEAAQGMPPREFIGIAIHESPESHLEKTVRLEWAFTQSQAKSVTAFFDAWRRVHESSGSDADVLEELMADWMLEHQSLIQGAVDGHPVQA